MASSMNSAQEPDGELVTIASERGPIEGRFHAVPGGTAAAVLVGGIDGGFDGPADKVYPDIARDLWALGVSALRLDFRLRISPGNVDEGAYDVMQGIIFLERQGLKQVGLVGHSFGAAVVITAGAMSPLVATVVTLSAQTYGTRSVNKLSPRPLLLVHGADDIRLPPAGSEYLFGRAGDPKELVILPDARHSLRQQREEVRRLVVSWLGRHLTSAGQRVEA